MNTVEHQEMLALRGQLLDLLHRASKRRPERPGVVDVGFGDEPEWAVYERDVLVEALDRHQVEQRRPGVLRHEVHAIEQSAAGHVDYAEKFTLRLAFLAYGQEWRP